MLSPPLALLKYPFPHVAKLTKRRYQTFTIVSVVQRIFLHGHPRDRQYFTMKNARSLQEGGNMIHG